MNELYLLTQDERKLFFQTAADIQNMPFEIIEKDFWVVWILGRLYPKKFKNRLNLTHLRTYGPLMLCSELSPFIMA